MASSRVARLVALCTVVAVLTGCNRAQDAPDPKGAGTTAPPTGGAELAAEEALGNMLDADGALPLDAALSIFAKRYAPLPGVEPAKEPLLDGDYALRVVALHLDELDAPRRAVVEKILGPPGKPLGDGSVETPTTKGAGMSGASPNAEPAVSIHDGSGPPRAKLAVASAGAQPLDRVALAEPILRDAIAYFAPKLGVTVDLANITLAVQPFAEPDGTHNFSSLTEAATATGNSDECLIRLNGDALYEERRFEAQVAHEGFHCLQYIAEDMRGVPQWVLEGSAAWASEEYTGGTSQSGGTWWRAWISRPEWNLERRLYDAIGVYSLAQASGTDGYRLIRALLASPNYGTLVSGTTSEFRNRWGTHLFKQPAWGASWDVIGPGVPGIPGQPTPVVLTVDTGPSRPPQPDRGQHNARVVEFEAPGDVLVVRVDGVFGGMHYDGGRERLFGPGNNGGLCLRAGGCACPGGAPPPVPLEEVSDRRVAIGTFDRSGTGVELESMSLERFCGVPPETTTTEAGRTDGCVVGRWVSTSFALPPVPTNPSGPATGGAGIVVVFAEGGAFSIDFDNMTPLVSKIPAPEGTPPIVSSMGFFGSVSGRWSQGAGGAISATVADLGAIRVKSTINTGGIVTPVLDRSLAEFGGAGGGAFSVARCAGATLQIRTLFSGGEAGMDFTRS